jgi:hypothetical protein
MSNFAPDFNVGNAVVAAFFITRASAIATYASVEQSLADLFSYLLGTPPDYSGVPFFRINNARARNDILERLLKKRHGPKHNLFWNCLVKYLREVDAIRNQIVHWGMLGVYNRKDGTLIRIRLIPPNYWDRDANTPKLTKEDIEAFSEKCAFLIRALDLLRDVASGKTQDRASLDICRQPITYPPPGNHPLSQKNEGSRALLRSSAP